MKIGTNIKHHQSIAIDHFFIIKSDTFWDIFTVMLKHSHYHEKLGFTFRNRGKLT